MQTSYTNTNKLTPSVNIKPIVTQNEEETFLAPLSIFCTCFAVLHPDIYISK